MANSGASSHDDFDIPRNWVPAPGGLAYFPRVGSLEEKDRVILYNLNVVYQHIIGNQQNARAEVKDRATQTEENAMKQDRSHGQLSGTDDMKSDAQSGLLSASHTQGPNQIHPEPVTRHPGVGEGEMSMAILPNRTLGAAVDFQDRRPQPFQGLVFATCKTEGAARWTEPTIHRLSACKSSGFTRIAMYKFPEMSPVFTAHGNEIMVIPVGPKSKQEYQVKIRNTAGPPERFTVWSWSFLGHDSSDFDAFLPDPAKAANVEDQSAKIVVKREAHPKITPLISGVQPEDRDTGDVPSELHEVERVGHLLQGENTQPPGPQITLPIDLQTPNTSRMATKRSIEVTGDQTFVKKARLGKAPMTDPYTNVKVLPPLSMFPVPLKSAKCVLKGQIIKTEAEHFTLEVFQTIKSGPGVILRSGPRGDIIFNVLASKISYKTFYSDSVEFRVDTRFSGSQATEYWNFQLRDQDRAAFRDLVDSAKEKSVAAGSSHSK